jgi:hypothetical protein
MHVHMVGNGGGGSGGWLRLKGWHRWLAGFMLRQLGVPASALAGNLESVYADTLLQLIRDSSMDAVVLSRTSAFTTLTAGRAMISAPCLSRTTLSSALRKSFPNSSPASPFIRRVMMRSMNSSAVWNVARSDEMPAELPEHRSLGSTVPAVLGTNGGGRSSASRSYGR